MNEINTDEDNVHPQTRAFPLSSHKHKRIGTSKELVLTTEAVEPVCIPI